MAAVSPGSRVTTTRGAALSPLAREGYFMAKLLKAIRGVPDGEVYPRNIPAGEECPPALVAYAIEIGALKKPPAKPKSGK